MALGLTRRARPTPAITPRNTNINQIQRRACPQMADTNTERRAHENTNTTTNPNKGRTSTKKKKKKNEKYKYKFQNKRAKSTYARKYKPRETFGPNTRRLFFARVPVCANTNKVGITRQDDVRAFQMVPSAHTGLLYVEAQRKVRFQCLSPRIACAQ